MAPKLSSFPKAIKNLKEIFAKFPKDLQNAINKHQKLILTIAFSGGATLASFGQRTSHPVNAINVQRVHVVTDDAYNAANTLAEQEADMNEGAMVAQFSLQQDTRLKIREIIYVIDIEAVPASVWYGTSDKNYDLGQFRGYMYDSANGADDRDMQIGQTAGGGYEAGSTAGVDNHATGDWCQTVSNGGGDNPVMITHETLASTGALSTGYQEGVSGITFHMDVSSIGGPSDLVQSTGETLGMGTGGGPRLPLISVPNEFNVGNPANGGDGFIYFTTMDNGGVPGWVAYTELDNVVQEGDGDNSSSGVVQFYNDYPGKLRVETTYYNADTGTTENFTDPVTPVVSNTGGILTLDNASAYGLKIPNTTDPNFAGIYNTPGDYEAYLYPANDVTNDAFVRKINMQDLIDGVDLNSLGLADGDYELAIYERKTNSIDFNNVTTVTVSATNEAPTSGNNSVSTLEDNAYSFNLADFPYTDAEGVPLNHVNIETLPTNGVLKLSGTAVSASDNITANDISNLSFEPNANWFGATSFSFKVSDGENYSDTQTFTINVTSVNDLPVPNVASLPDVNQQCEITATDMPVPSATDVEDGTIWATTSTAFPINTQGNNTVTWNYTDSDGGVSTQTQNGIINDTTNPEAIGSNFQVDLAGNSSVTILPSDVDNGSFDNCGNVTLSLNQDTFTDVGVFDVDLIATDEQGLQDSVTVQITIIDSTASVDNPEIAGFSMYPNPVKDRLTIKTANEAIDEIIIFNALGQKVFSEKYDGDYLLIELDVRDLPAEKMYFIKTTSGGKTQVEKFIKE